MRKDRGYLLIKENIFSCINAHGIQETYLVVQNFKLQPNISTYFYPIVN